MSRLMMRPPGPEPRTNESAELSSPQLVHLRQPAPREQLLQSLRGRVLRVLTVPRPRLTHRYSPRPGR